jgi:hypothetical protein
MIKKTIIIVLTINCFSCAKDIVREKTSSYVYYNNLPVKKAKVLTWQGADKGFIQETVTNNSGFFSLPEKSRYRLGLESQVLSQQVVIVSKGFLSDTLSTFGKYVKSDKIISDTIHLKPIKDMKIK